MASAASRLPPSRLCARPAAPILARLFLVLVALLWAPGSAEAGRRRKAPGPIHYTLSVPSPTSRYVHVQVDVRDAPGAQTRLAMAAWAPGSYLVRDFGRHVYDFTAHAVDGGAELPVARADKQTWVIDNQGQAFSVSYRVFAGELSVRTSYLDDSFALLNGTSVFVYEPGALERPVSLSVDAPPEWSVHTALDPAAPHSQTQFEAVDFDELADSPLLLSAEGVSHSARFEVAGAELEFVFAAPSGSNAELPRMAADAEAIVRAFARTFNGLPFERYVFLLVADPVGGGGLEHLDSTAMIVRPWIFGQSRGYERVQRLIAHEFFHLWNVKRIHDEVLGPFDYSQENYTELLWFHEGFTETMEARAMLRAGELSPQRYLDELASAWSSYRRKPGRNYSPIASLSQEAWIKSYQPAANHGETTISYYEKGNLIGVCLDLSLRLRAQSHGGEGSIEGLFRRLWAQRDPRTQSVAITIDDIVAAASAEAGEDMRWFFDAYVYGTDELPLPELLDQAGFAVEDSPQSGDAAAWTGMAGGTQLSLVEPDSPAAAAGLMLGDELIAVGDARVRDVGQAKARIGELGVGATTPISLFRRDRLVTVELTAAASPHRRWTFRQPEGAATREPAAQGPAQDPALDPAFEQLRRLWLLEHLEHH